MPPVNILGNTSPQTNYDPRWQLLQMRVFEKRIAEAFIFCRQNEIEPILIKGWAAAQSYREPWERNFVDIDLVIAPANYDAALEILKNFQGGMPIDLHKGAKHLDTVSFEDLFARSKLVECGEIEVRILCPEDHLRILCVHWLTDGGANKKRLWDIYYAVANRPSDFDWERCLNVVSERRRKWVICAIAITHKYLDLPIDETPAACTVSEIPDWVIKTIEKEWSAVEGLIPLNQTLSDKKQLWRQIKKRLPPNPIQATIDMEGEFDDKSRLYYQIGDIFLRLKPSIKRIIETVF